MRLFSRLAIRSRITIGSVAVAAVLFAIAVMAVQAQIGTILMDADSSLAASDVSAFASELAKSPASTIDDPVGGLLLFARGSDGTVLVDTMPAPIQHELEHRADASGQFTTSIDDTGFVVVGRTITAASGEWSLWAARSTASSALVLQELNIALVVGALALLIGFGFASWFLATAALRPVERMRRRAAVLGEDPGDGGLPVGEARDEITQLAVTLNELLDRVRRSALRERRMVSDAAHELRTPLAVLRTQLELAHDDFDDAAALGMQIVAAEASVARLTALANNLLELSRLESQHGATKRTSFDRLVTELMASIDRARILGLSRELDIGFTLESVRDDASYAVSPSSFARLLDNLIMNAAAAVPDGGSVIVSLVQSPTQLRLTVRDNGPGMAAEFIPHAFERFSRADESRSAATGGSGLGLALVKAIATDAGGTVFLANGEPGLAVTVTLPQM